MDWTHWKLITLVSCDKGASHVSSYDNKYGSVNKSLKNFDVPQFLKTIGSFSRDYEYDYEYKIRHFRTKLGAVCLQHLTKLVVVGLLTTKSMNKTLIKSSTTTSFDYEVHWVISFDSDCFYAYLNINIWTFICPLNLASSYRTTHTFQNIRKQVAHALTL